MPKPSILQIILNKPSRSYAFPATREYHSTKPELIRIAGSASPSVDCEAKNTRESIVIFGSSPPRRRIPPTSGESSQAEPEILERADDDGNVPDDNPESDDDNDVFYTPLTSPYTSLALSDSVRVPMTTPAADSTPDNSTDDDDYSSDISIFTSSTFPLSADTHLTTPPESDFGHHHHPLHRKGNLSITSTGGQVQAVSRPTTIKQGTRPHSHSHQRSQSASAASSSSSSSARRKAMYVGDAQDQDDWAREVRWLGGNLPPPPPHNQTKSSARSSRSSTSFSTITTHSNANGIEIGDGFVVVDGGVGVTSGGKGKGKCQHRNDKERMSAVMEEDEDETSLLMSSPRNSRTLNPSRSKNRLRTHSSPSSSTSHHRSKSPAASLQPPPRPPPPPRTSSSQSHSQTHTLPTPIPASTASTGHSYSYTTLVLPRATTSLDDSRSGIFGLGGRGPKKFTGGGGKVDLTRSGMAQTTMVSVEVVRGVASTLPRSHTRSVRSMSIRSFSSGSKTGKGKGKSLEEEVSNRYGLGLGSGGGHVEEDLGTPLALTSHLSPPSYVPASCVLVQVWAVGLDGVDLRLVWECVGASGSGNGSTKGKGVGYVPGRSVVGRAVECGISVREEECRRGEWVVGLLDVRKCGALAEFVLVERHRLHRVPPPPPPPTQQPLSRSPSSSSYKSRSGSQSRPGSQSRRRTSSINGIKRKPPPPLLSLEELALIPVVGVPAWRAVRTFDSVFSYYGKGGRGEGTGRRMRAFVIGGHDGVGGMVLQMLAWRGVAVVCAPGGGDVGVSAGEEKRRERERLVEKRMRGWGAAEVCWPAQWGDGVLGVIQRLAVEEESQFDLVLDTVGGRDVWKACQRILRSGGQFTTIVGDVVGRVVPSGQDHFWAGLRSMGMKRGSSERGAGNGAEKGRKEIGYAWVSVAADVDMEGEDVADTLRAVLRMAEEAGIRPWAGGREDEDEEKVVPFERAPDLFKRHEGVLKDGGTAVVKIVG